MQRVSSCPDNAPRARCGPYRGRRIIRAALPANTYSFDTAFSTCNSFLNEQPLAVGATAAREEQPFAAPILFNALPLAAPQPPLGHRSDAQCAAAAREERRKPRKGRALWRLTRTPHQLNSQSLWAAVCVYVCAATEGRGVAVASTLSLISLCLAEAGT